MGFRVARGGGTGYLAAPLASEEPRTEPVLAASAESDDFGARLFSDNCSACHMIPTAFRGIYGKDQTSVESTIRTGGNSVMSMPEFGELLTDEEITALASLVRALNGWE